ncbi:class 1 isoprenoid biosynthesis enzyme [Streptomyces wuyuanensis]|uniref:class 1 isoprenoid biosynthesis enzyme n=1 Tax=Streptomyces wuyuanensis TaxID=1196353 RepID=UPI003435C4FF
MNLAGAKGYDASEPVSQLLADAVHRIDAEWNRDLPLSASAVREWTLAVSGGQGLEAYFLHPSAFPMVFLSWWLDESLGITPDVDFHQDLIGAAVRGYLGIRLIDDVMDRDSSARPDLLPLVAVFFARFQSVFARRFSADDVFWRTFHHHWTVAADSAVCDGAAGAVENTSFQVIGAHKLDASLILMAAASRHAGLEEIPGPWVAFFRQLAEWHQFRNDLRDWYRDWKRGASTLVLAEAEKACPADVNLETWMIRGGLADAHTALIGRLQRLYATAESLGSPGAIHYLNTKRSETLMAARSLQEGVQELARLVAPDMHSSPGGK